MATKFIYISTEEEMPEYGTHIVISYDGQLLLSRYNKYSTEEWFKSNYKFWLKEVTDVEIELKELLKETHSMLENSIESLTSAKQKIEYYQEQLKTIRENGNEIQKSNDK
jgi:2-hydroxy-3-keto-5-methylthiopentenyl-1-phosphate phosphatase